MRFLQRDSDRTGTTEPSPCPPNTTSYVYDSANQLTRENNQAGGFTHIWTYDNAGNILTREEYAYTTGVLGDKLKSVEYKYEDTKGWGDLLTDYDGTEIDYDDIGNPTEDGTWTYNWEHGRELASMTSKDGSGLTWTYTYNANGLRTKRTNGTTTYNYVYYGGQLQYMEVNGSKMFLTTAPDGTPMGIIYAGDAYYYMTNLQGDVVGLINQQGEIVVEYTYDAWGNPLTTTGSMADTLGQINPFRYRGYVYDSETGLYYLQSRYYDPEMGRFLNADAYTSTGQGLLGNNMFAYCGNNPISYFDAQGCYYANYEDRLTTGHGGGGSLPARSAENRKAKKSIIQLINSSIRSVRSFMGLFIGNDAQAAADAEYLYIYNGAPIIKMPSMDDSAFSFGFIFMGDEANEQLVKHEYGHTKQLKELGLVGYLYFVAAPSVTYYWLCELEEGSWELYNSMPWEYKASEFGDVEGDYAPWARPLSDAYWNLTQNASELISRIFLFP